MSWNRFDKLAINDDHAPEAKIDYWEELERISENPWECPHCSLPLIVKRGRQGKFLGCPNYPACRHTHSLISNFSSRVFCEKCNNTGLLPFIKPDGTVSKHAKIFCDCHLVYGTNAHYGVAIATEGKRPPTRGAIPRGRRHLYVDDFDFPVSYDFYRSLCQKHGWQDPGPNYPPKPEPVALESQEIIHRHINYNSDVSKKQWVRIDAISGELGYLRQQVTEMRAEKKKSRGKY